MGGTFFRERLLAAHKITWSSVEEGESGVFSRNFTVGSSGCLVFEIAFGAFAGLAAEEFIESGG